MGCLYFPCTPLREDGDSNELSVHPIHTPKGGLDGLTMLDVTGWLYHMVIIK